MLFPPLISEEMLDKTTFGLKNGETVELGIADFKDLDAIIDIQKACYHGEAPWGRIAVNNELRNKKSSFFLMVYYRGEAVSFIGISSRDDGLHVTNIATHPLYQKNGIATFLIQRVVAIAQKLEKKRITLEVRMSNENAKKLYRKIGFQDGRIKRNYYHSNGEDALDMYYRVDKLEGLDESQFNE